MFKIENPLDKFASHSMDLQYMKTIRLFLLFLWCWPQDLLREKVNPLAKLYNILLSFLTTLFIILIFKYIMTVIGTVPFQDIIPGIINFGLAVLCLQRITMPWLTEYFILVKDFVEKMHLFYYRHDSEYTERTYKYINKVCTVFSKVLYTEAFFGLTMLSLMPVYNNYQNGLFGGTTPPHNQQYEHSIDYSVPFDHRTNLGGYLVVVVANTWFIYNAVWCGYAIDLILCIMVFHVWGHLKILDHNLKTFPKPAEMRTGINKRQKNQLLYDEDENKQVAIMLKKLIDHHVIIVRFVQKISSAFGPMLYMWYTINHIGGCLILMQCSAVNTQSFGRYVIFTLTTYHLIMQFSVTMELIGSQSDTLVDAVYGLPWECMDTRNRKIVLHFLFNVREPIRIKPLGMLSVGVKTMASIFKTAYTYYMFLRTFA